MPLAVAWHFCNWIDLSHASVQLPSGGCGDLNCTENALKYTDDTITYYPLALYYSVFYSRRYYSHIPYLTLEGVYFLFFSPSI